MAHRGPSLSFPMVHQQRSKDRIWGRVSLAQNLSAELRQRGWARAAPKGCAGKAAR